MANGCLPRSMCIYTRCYSASISCDGRRAPGALIGSLVGAVAYQAYSLRWLTRNLDEIDLSRVLRGSVPAKEGGRVVR